MKSDVAIGIGIFLWFGVIFAIFVGWIMNIFKMIEMINEPLAGEFILRIVGIFFVPLGSIMGLFVAG